MRIVGLLMIIGITFLFLMLVQDYVTIWLMVLIVKLLRIRQHTSGFAIVSFTFNAFFLYLILAVFTQTVLDMDKHDRSTGWFIFYSAVCALTVFGLISQSIINKSQDGLYENELDYNDTTLMANLDTIKGLLAVPLFVLFLFFPALAINGLTVGLYHLMLWIGGIFIIGFIVGAIGLFMALTVTWGGVVGIAAMLFGAVSAIRRGSAA